MNENPVRVFFNLRIFRLEELQQTRDKENVVCDKSLCIRENAYSAIYSEKYIDRCIFFHAAAVQ